MHHLWILIVLITSTLPQYIVREKEYISKDKNLPSESKLRIALVQTVPETNQDKNLVIGESICRKAREMDADIVLFPEMYNISYALIDQTEEDPLEAWKNKAIPPDDPFVIHFQNLAIELEIAIAITYLEKSGDNPRNTVTLFDRYGKRILSYSKVHTTDMFPREAALSPGEDFHVAELDTRHGPLMAGFMICYDREFPESARILMLKGAELILTPNACPLDTLRLVQFQSRAWENAVAVAMANYGKKDWYDGHSCAFNADGSKIIIAGEETGIYIAEIDLEELREIRNNTYWGNAFRRPSKYKLLISDSVKPPFIRENAFGEEFIRSKR